VVCVGSEDFEKARSALAATDAHRHDGVFRAATFAFDQRMAGHAGTRHAIRMPDRNRPAIDVKPFVRDAQLVAAIKHLGRESLVQLPQPDVVDFQARSNNRGTAKTGPMPISSGAQPAT
jgi:hypothetical protein